MASIFTHLIHKDGVATITINDLTSNKNVADFKRDCEQFTDLCRNLIDDDNVKAVLLRSDKPSSFYSGALMRTTEPYQTKESAKQVSLTAQKMTSTILNSKKPFIAAIAGEAMDVGLEIALACHYRAAFTAKATRLGLTNIFLGVTPVCGMDGQLLTLVGVEKAMKMMTSPSTVNVSQALRMGLINQQVDAPSFHGFQVRALHIARMFATGIYTKDTFLPSTLHTLPMRFGAINNHVFKSIETAIKKKGGNATALKVAELIKHELMNWGCNNKEFKAEVFADLATSDDCHGAIHAAACKRRLYKKSLNVCDSNVKKIAIVGAGFMGTGIANVSANHGDYKVILKDVSAAGLARSKKQLESYFDRKLKDGDITLAERHRVLENVTYQMTYAGFDKVDLVIEAVFEDIDVKRKVVQEIEQHIRDDCILATNTSALPISHISEVSARPSNMVGMHYFDAVGGEMLEIVTSKDTSEQAINRAITVGVGQAKVPFIVKECPGFYANRCLSTSIGESVRMQMEGIPPKLIDDACWKFGFPIKVSQFSDGVGLDVTAKVASYLYEKLNGAEIEGTREHISALEKLVETGRLGKKNLSGFYDYSVDDKGNVKTIGPNKEAYRTLRAHLTNNFEKDTRDDVAETVHVRPEDVDDIPWRMVLRYLNETAITNSEGVLESTEDADAVSVYGVGFPFKYGGPFKMINRLGADKLMTKMKCFEKKYGGRFTPSAAFKALVNK